MPITAPVSGDEDLSQGDILKGVPFFIGSDDVVVTDTNVKYVLVISRPCKALRDEHVVIAPVFERTLGLKSESLDDLTRARRFLAGKRDGVNATELSDFFYLGFIDGTSRYAASLLQLATIRVPTGDKRQSWVQQKRVSRLQPDFVRDLHTRLTLSYTRLGFDDYGWLEEKDLELLIASGNAEVATLEQALSAVALSLHAEEGAKASATAGREKEASNLRNKVEAAKAALRPYQDELARRKQA